MWAPVLRRTKDIPIGRYLDDLLLRENLTLKLTSHVQQTLLNILELFNWVLNIQKSALHITQRLEYLILMLNMEQAKVLHSQKNAQVESLKKSLNSDLHQGAGENGSCLCCNPQSHSWALQLSILPVWDRHQKTLTLHMHLTYKTRLTLDWWISTQMDTEKSLLPMNLKIMMTLVSLLSGKELWRTYLQPSTFKGFQSGCIWTMPWLYTSTVMEGTWSCRPDLLLGRTSHSSPLVMHITGMENWQENFLIHQ